MFLFLCGCLTHINAIRQVYVDALGPTKAWEQQLSSVFPNISFTVTAKADSKYKIVGAASVAAKVTRDTCIEGWVFDEERPLLLQESSPFWSKSGKQKEERLWESEVGSGYPGGRCFLSSKPRATFLTAC